MTFLRARTFFDRFLRKWINATRKDKMGILLQSVECWIKIVCWLFCTDAPGLWKTERIGSKKMSPNLNRLLKGIEMANSTFTFYTDKISWPLFDPCNISRDLNFSHRRLILRSVTLKIDKVIFQDKSQPEIRTDSSRDRTATVSAVSCFSLSFSLPNNLLTSEEFHLVPKRKKRKEWDAWRYLITVRC